MLFLVFLIVGLLFIFAISGLITFIDSRVRLKKTSRLEAFLGLLILSAVILLTVLVIPFGMWGLLPSGVGMALLVLHQPYIALFRPYIWENENDSDDVENVTLGGFN